jgi:hypothetical protein
MRLDQFQELLQSLSPIEFEKFVADLLRRSGRFTDIHLVGGVGVIDRGVDVEAHEYDPILGRPRRWVFQIKKTRVVGPDVARYMYAIAHEALQEGPTQVVLVAAGTVSRSAREILSRTGIQVWDSQKLAELASPDLVAEWFASESSVVTQDVDVSQKALAFVSALDSIVPGEKGWSSYQRLIADILEFLFCPPLELPRYELSDADARNRRDIIFENPSGDGFWSQLRGDYSAFYVVVDAKNYAKPVPKRAVLDIAHYLKPYGVGMFALLISRREPSSGAAHASREQWIGGKKMIVHLGDAGMKEMLDLKTRGGEPSEVIRRRIADFRMSL